MLYSVVATCKQLGIDPFEYLRDVLARLPDHAAEQHSQRYPSGEVHSSGLRRAAGEVRGQAGLTA